MLQFPYGILLKQTSDNKQGNTCRSAPKGRQQMGETGFCENLRFSAVSCENLRFPAVSCANLRLPNPLIYRASRKSAKICKNLRKCAFGSGFSLLLSPFWRALNINTIFTGLSKIVPAIFGDFLAVAYVIQYFPPRTRQHLNNFDPHPFPGRSRKVVYVY